VSYHDFSVPRRIPARTVDLERTPVPCPAAEYARYDGPLLPTADSEFRNAELSPNARLMVNTREVAPPDFRRRGISA
jgi:hypothetical protein